MNRALNNYSPKLNKRLAIIYYYRETWDESIFDNRETGWIRLAQSIGKFFLGFTMIALLKLTDEGYLTPSRIVLWLFQIISIGFGIWAILLLINYILGRFKIGLPKHIWSIFLILDGILFQIIYLPAWLFFSLFAYIHAIGYRLTRTKLEDLVKLVAAPYIFVGTLSELLASFFQSP